MKKFMIISLLLPAIHGGAQDYLNCISDLDHGFTGRAQNCVRTLESKYPADPAFYYYNMLIAVQTNDKVQADKLYGSADKYIQTDPYIRPARTAYLLREMDIEGAKKMFEQVMVDRKKTPEVVLLRTITLFISMRKKDPAYAFQCINLLEKELKQPHAGWLLLKGDYYASLGDQGAALNYYNQSIDADQKNEIAYYKKAIAYERIKNFSTALIELETALKLKPEFPLAIHEKADILFETNKVDEGMAAYARYFELVPGDNNTRIGYGAALFGIKKYVEAGKIADDILANDPEHLKAKKLKAYVEYESGNYTTGVIYLQSYLEKADTLRVARDYEYLARYYMKNGNDSLAIEAYKTAFSYVGALPESYSDAGTLMMKKFKYADALATYAQKLERHKGTSADYYTYGRAALALEQYQLADSIFGKVCELQPTWPNGFLMRANANAHLDPGSTEGKALPYYEKYVSLAEPDTANAGKYKSGLLEAYRYLGYYYFLNKDIEKSKSWWNKVLILEPDDKQAKEVLKQL